MIKTYEIDEQCNLCDSCGEAFDSLNDMNPGKRGCLCDNCNHSYTTFDAMEAGVIDFKTHVVDCMKRDY